MTEESASCVEPTTSVSGEEAREHGIERVKMDVARVGKKAPDFTAQAYYAGAFKQVSLSDYEGKWRTLCFYPGDFTFV